MRYSGTVETDPGVFEDVICDAPDYVSAKEMVAKGWVVSLEDVHIKGMDDPFGAEVLGQMNQAIEHCSLGEALAAMAPPVPEWTPERPAYYRLASGDVMDIIDELALNFQRGSAVKYILRAGRKPGADEVHDLRKAVECLNREIARLQKGR